jgi:uncharacterized protein (TIGR03435 family)
MSSTPNRRTILILCATLTLIAACPRYAQAQTAPPLEFEAATIKPVDPHASMTMMGTDVTPDGVVKLYGQSLITMIEDAFDLNYVQITGGEPWMETNRYNVVAEPPDVIRPSHPDTRLTWYTLDNPRLREMLQTLLIQRFNLKIHRTTQIGQVYLLERTSKPLGLRPAKVDNPAEPVRKRRAGNIGWAGAWYLDDATMPELANFAGSNELNRPVLDHTGLTGAFDYRAAPDATHASPVDQDNSFLQMLEDVGLKLTPSTGPVETLTIDYAEPPTPN